MLHDCKKKKRSMQSEAANTQSNVCLNALYTLANTKRALEDTDGIIVLILVKRKCMPERKQRKTEGTDLSGKSKTTRYTERTNDQLHNLKFN